MPAPSIAAEPGSGSGSTLKAVSGRVRGRRVDVERGVLRHRVPILVDGSESGIRSPVSCVVHFSGPSWRRKR